MIVIYPLAEPQKITLTAAEMAALMELQTYSGVTNITNSDGADMDVKYCTNKNLSECVIPITTALQAQIDELKSAVLSLGGNVCGNKYNTKVGSLYGICKNSNSIGIEICCMNSIGPKNGKMPDANDASYSFTDTTVANAEWLVKKLMAEYVRLAKASR
ncbi:MAG: N-acetylmuramoyl-L-alanine amidase [Oscillospiraceae bacterium]